MGIRILLITIIAISGCASYESERETFIEEDIKVLVEDADYDFESGDYRMAFEKYQKALSDLRVLVSITEDKLELSTFALDTLEINNKMEVARIGALMK